MSFGGNNRAHVFSKQHGWSDGGRIDAKYNSRAANSYRRLLAKEVAKSVENDAPLPSSPVAVQPPEVLNAFSGVKPDEMKKHDTSDIPLPASPKAPRATVSTAVKMTGGLGARKLSGKPNEDSYERKPEEPSLSIPSAKAVKNIQSAGVSITSRVEFTESVPSFDTNTGGKTVGGLVALPTLANFFSDFAAGGGFSKKTNSIPSKVQLEETDEARKFSNAKSVSSQFFGDSNKLDVDAKVSLQKFLGSSFISSSDLFGRIPAANLDNLSTSDLINRLSFQMITVPTCKQNIIALTYSVMVASHFVVTVGENDDHFSRRKNLGWEGNRTITILVACALFLVSMYKYSTYVRGRVNKWWGALYSAKDEVSPSLKSQCNIDSVIGINRFGTVVYKGVCGESGAAIKRYDSILFDDLKMNAYLFDYKRLYPQHPNILSCYHVEIHDSFIYVAWELGACNLEKFIEIASGMSNEKIEGIDNVQLWNPRKKYHPSSIMLHLMRDMVEGLHYMHKNVNIYNHLSPNNVLIMKNGDSVCAKLCDPKLDDLFSSHLYPVKYPQGYDISIGWEAPELLKAKVNRKAFLAGKELQNGKACDIFSLGFLFLFLHHWETCNGGKT